MPPTAPTPVLLIAPVALVTLVAPVASVAPAVAVAPAPSAPAPPIVLVAPAALASALPVAPLIPPTIHDLSIRWYTITIGRWVGIFVGWSSAAPHVEPAVLDTAAAQLLPRSQPVNG
ncbi:hypothetical protein BD779DRAFT_1680017 [Infundibulicybe gibba]|nr:hypothetical protein BD779DRAFT_1680017 [Infundibulicybe gibba]